jgi:opacity protein-like surface antigen
MKKLLLVAASTALLSSTAFAQEDAFYVRADVGVSHFISAKDKATKLKLKTDHSPLMSLAIGYGVMDTVRAELELGHHFNPQLSKTGTAIDNDGDRTDNVKATHKARITSLMVKGIVDLFDAGPAKLFAGAGVGMARVSEKVTYSVKVEDASFTLDHKSRSKNNMAYTLLAGAGFEVSEGVMLDVTYSYNSYGNTKAVKDTNNEVGKTRLHGHMGKLGLRFNI